jgi:hypothetical protein
MSERFSSTISARLNPETSWLRKLNWIPSKPDYEYTDEEIIQTPLFNDLKQAAEQWGSRILSTDELIRDTRDAIALIWAEIERERWITKTLENWDDEDFQAQT